jgi:phosphonate transport system permease protein
MSETAPPQVRPKRPRPRLTTVAITIGLIVFTLWTADQVGFDGSTFWEMWGSPIWAKFWPVPWDWVLSWDNVFEPLVETFQIAIIATLVGCILALPISFAMSRLTSHNRFVYVGSRGTMGVVRAVPDLFWAKLLVVAVGIGAFAGAWALSIFSLAVMVKLFSETIDAADPRPLEAARAAGGRHIPAVRTSVLPAVFPTYIAYALYIFELNIRASLVLGLVGAGGIGRVIEAQRQFFRFDRVLGILIIIFVVVMIIEQISLTVRKRLI